MTPQTIQLADDTIKRYANFPSAHTSPRHVDVWTPPTYKNNQPLPVLYMHDGQNVFDPKTSTYGVTWGVREAITRLIDEGVTQGCIVVGIWNSTERWRDYMPEDVFERPEAKAIHAEFTQHAGGMPQSNGYLRFLVEEVKPFIDASHKTRADQANTFIIGSSMGGLISLYAIETYPEVFGAAACLSTHWSAGENLLVDYLGAHLPHPDNHKLYFDFGTVGLDAAYEPFQQRMDQHLQDAGYEQGKNWLTKKFEGANHNEDAWQDRVHIPLEFLLGDAPINLNGAEKAHLYRDYFNLQLRFADVLANALNLSFSQSVLIHSNFYRRFALGSPKDAATSADWQRYVSKLDSLQTHEERLEWTTSFYSQCKPETLPSRQRLFGCFSLELRDEGKLVRVHFGNTFAGEAHPLARVNSPKRLQEITELCGYVKKHHPEAENVHGASWLYGLEAYCRLFPPEFTASRQVLTGMKGFQGSSSWGQLIDHRGNIKPNLRERFLANLTTLDANKPWEVFPLPTFITVAPIEVFFDHYL